MKKRYLDCNASDLINIKKSELLYAIRASEGRLLMSENIAVVPSLLGSITNAELAASQGADLLLLNMFDVNNPVICGMPENIAKDSLIKALKRFTGCVIGVNLEAIDPDFSSQHDEIWQITEGRKATAKNAMRLVEMGVDFIVLTGNPNNGISNEATAQSLKTIHQAVGDKTVLITGKMHSAGIVAESGKALIDQQAIDLFIENGADIILLPAPGTIPGMSQERVSQLIDHTHQKNRLAMTAIGTSQEGADQNTIRQIALMSKMAGADIHHIGDTGYLGLALPENINSYSIAIRGVRHTYARMARSVCR